MRIEKNNTSDDDDHDKNNLYNLLFFKNGDNKQIFGQNISSKATNYIDNHSFDIKNGKCLLDFDNYDYLVGFSSASCTGRNECEKVGGWEFEVSV